MSNRIQVLLLDREHGKSLTFPINPEQIIIPHANETNTYKILNYGEVNIIGDRKAQAFELSNFLPEKSSVWAELSYLIDFMKYKPYTQDSAIELLETWWKEKTVIRLIAGIINVECRISEFNLTQYERNADLGYSIKLLEYRDPEHDAKIKKQNDYYKNNPAENPHDDEFGLQRLKSRAKDRFLPQYITGQKGQTIYKIAKLYYGGDFKALAAYNKLENKLNTDIGGMIIEFPLKTP